MGIGHDHPVAEQLRDHLDIRRLTAAGTRPGELKQRLGELAALDAVLLQRRLEADMLVGIIPQRGLVLLAGQ